VPLPLREPHPVLEIRPDRTDMRPTVRRPDVWLARQQVRPRRGTPHPALLVFPPWFIIDGDSRRQRLDLENIFPLLIGLSAMIGLPLALLARKKGSPK